MFLQAVAGETENHSLLISCTGLMTVDIGIDLPAISPGHSHKCFPCMPTAIS